MVALLRPGDVLTHAFRPFPNCAGDRRASIKPRGAGRRAKRGVLFDIGHGMGSFAFKTARDMLANGFLPDTISSDVHQLCIDGPAFDQVTTLSKFLCLGMPLTDVIAASTVNAAMALQRPGARQPEARQRSATPRCSKVEEGRFDYVDVVGEHLDGGQRIVSKGVVVAGKWWWPA